MTAGGVVVVFGGRVAVSVAAGAEVVIVAALSEQPETTAVNSRMNSRQEAIKQVLLKKYISLLYLPGSNAVFSVTVDPSILGYRLCPLS